MIETSRLTIRRVTADDWQAAQRIWADFSLSEYAQYDTPHPTDDESVRARIARWAQYAESMEHMFFAVCLEGEMIGYIAFNARETGHEIGYCFHSSAHGKGYAKEAHLALFGHMRAQGFTHFIVRTALANLPSVRLLAALGFRQTGGEKVSFYKDAEGKDIVFDGGMFELDIG